MNKILALLVATLLLTAAPVLAAPQVDVTGANGVTPATASNSLPVFLSDSTKNTYTYAIDFFTPYATPTDIVGIVGSATKTVKIHKIFLSGTQTTAGINKWYLIVRSTADTGGSPSAATAVKLDSSNAAATAVIQKYTAAPTTGTLVGNARIMSVLAPAPAGTNAADNVLFDDAVTGQPITLRGVAQELDLNFAGAAVPTGLSVAVTTITTEE